MLDRWRQFPVSFDLKAVVVDLDPKKAFKRINSESPSTRASGRVVFFWPKDFTFVCPTEIAAFGKLNRDFSDRDAVLLGASIDSEFVHLAWRENHADLKDLPFPMLADIKRELSDGAGHSRHGRRRAPARDVHRRPGRCDPLRDGDRSQRRPQSRRKCCASWMRCRPTNSAPATGRRARTSSSRPRNAASATAAAEQARARTAGRRAASSAEPVRRSEALPDCSRRASIRRNPP